MKKLIGPSVLTAVLAGCGGGNHDCNSEISDLLKANGGSAESIEKFDDGNYHSWTYWYYKKGFSRTFTWGEPVESCKVSNFSFTPSK